MLRSHKRRLCSDMRTSHHLPVDVIGKRKNVRRLRAQTCVLIPRDLQQLVLIHEDTQPDWRPSLQTSSAPYSGNGSNGFTTRRICPMYVYI